MANILIVDDSRTSRKILRTMLESAGHNILDEAANGEEGIEKYLDLKPDLTTMDITMPVMDGIEALKQIRMLDNNAKIVMVTAAGQKSKMIEAIKFGAADFITKPFEPDHIISIVNKLTK